MQYNTSPVFTCTRTLGLISAGALAIVLSGCMQSTTGGDEGASDVYVYKGRADPLMAEPVANRTAKLSERFKLIQARQ